VVDRRLRRPLISTHRRCGGAIPATVPAPRQRILRQLLGRPTSLVRELGDQPLDSMRTTDSMRQVSGVVTMAMAPSGERSGKAMVPAPGRVGTRRQEVDQ
jgi:hypothetical protein